MENKKIGAVTPELIKTFRANFEADPKNLLASNACSKLDPMEMCLRRRVTESTVHVFTHKVDEVKPATNQKTSGRCWLFALLNAMRIPFAKHLQLEDFEFSTTYLFFWDKIERSNYFLHAVIQALQKGEPVDGRLMSFLLHDPITDGGQWEMTVNLVERYGVMPKKCYPDTFTSDLSVRLNNIIKSKVREYTRDLNILIRKGCSEEKLEEKVKMCLEELYKVIGICLGIPNETFTWEYYNKSKAYCVIGPITPLEFYEKHVKPHYNVSNKICVVNDPRPENPPNHTYTIEYLNNMVGGRKVVYLNLKIKDLLKYASESVKNGESVWFGCDISKMVSLKSGILDLRIFDYKMLFGIDINKNLSKAERLSYGESSMTHAMLFTAVSFDSNGDPVKWRVENSWGEDRGEKGYLLMTSEWFEEYVYEIVVDKQYIPKEVVELLKMEPKVLPAWDPMGTLA